MERSFKRKMKKYICGKIFQYIYLKYPSDWQDIIKGYTERELFFHWVFKAPIETGIFLQHRVMFKIFNDAINKTFKR